VVLAVDDELVAKVESDQEKADVVALVVDEEHYWRQHQQVRYRKTSSPEVLS
jgi:hypothetical protein